MVCNLQGVPVFYSGPHLGVMSDLNIFKQNRPPVAEGRVLLADKAYQNSEGLPVVTPIKENMKAAKDKDRNAIDALIQWYRSTIEHLFAYLKRYLILGGTFRGTSRPALLGL